MAQNSKSSKGPSQRQLRVGELIRRSLSEVLQRGEIHDPDLNRIPITVTEVKTSPDLRVATTYVLPLGGQNNDEALALLRKNRHEIRRILAKTMQLKNSPEMRFVIDETFDKMEETRQLLAREDVQRDLKGNDDPAHDQNDDHNS